MFKSARSESMYFHYFITLEKVVILHSKKLQSFEYVNLFSLQSPPWKEYCP